MLDFFHDCDINAALNIRSVGALTLIVALILKGEDVGPTSISCLCRS
jgi:hypothetical protein